MSPRIERLTLSVGLNMNFANDEDLNRAKVCLELQSTFSPEAGLAIKHMQALEALIDVEKYATLSRMADDMRNHLAEIRLNQAPKYNAGYQHAINLVIDKLEDIDLDTQAVTSIAELQAATVREAQTLCVNPDDYQAVGNYAQAIIDGAQ